MDPKHFLTPVAPRFWSTLPLTFLVIVMAALYQPVHAASPTQPLKIVVPFAAGGPSDRIALAFADAARRHWPNRTVVVENVGGDGGTVGALQVAGAPADGSVVLLQNIAMAAAPALHRLPYDALDDFEYLGMLEEVPMTLVGHPGLPDTVPALIEWIKAASGSATLAHAGIGSASHLCGMLVQNAIQLPMTMKAYPGNGPAMTDVVEGKTHLLCDPTTSAARQIEAGKVHAFALTASSRLNTPALKQVPTFAELGLPNTDITVWFGLCAPRGTPATAIQQLNALLRAVAADKTFVESQESTGALVIRDSRQSPGEHKRFVSSEIEHWGSIIRGLKSADTTAAPRGR